MAFKRQIDRLPIIPADAKVHNVTCHYCIVGCGYKAYSWPINQQGGTAASENWAGVDLSENGLALLREKGMEVHEPTPEELAAFKEATRPSFDKWAAQIGPEIVQLFTDEVAAQ